MNTGGIKKFLLKVALPIIVILILFIYNIFLGLATLVLFIAYVLFSRRASLLAFAGSIKYSRGDLEQSVKWFGRSYKTGRASNRHATSYAYLLLKSGKIDESEEVLKKLLASKPDKDDEMYAKSNLALALWKKGDLDAALEILEEVIASYKTSAVYGSLGYLRILKGDLAKALEFNLEAYEYNNTNTVILDNLGQTYYLTAQYDKAKEIYETLVSKNPAFPEAYYNYGLLLGKLGQPENALEMVKKSLNYRISFLSTISRDDIEAKIREIGDKPENEIVN